MRVLILAAILAVAACSPRAELSGGAARGAQAEQIFVASTRAPDSDPAIGFGPGRSETLTLARFDVAIPPDRKPGTLTVPAPGKTPDPRTTFLIKDQRAYAAPADFRRDLGRALSRANGEAIVFVHGYNNNFAEGLYRNAQIGADFDLPAVMAHYAWPSQGHVLGYAYDHDSALFARDGLVALLDQIRAAGARRIILAGHSMGGFLTMEALRQMTLSGDRATLDRIGGVILISPDIDVDVFRAEARTIGRLPQPFIVFASQRDKALGVSAQLSGQPTRLGNLTDIERVADLKVTMIDTARFDTQGGHFNVADSPALIQLLKHWDGLARILQGEQGRRRDPVASAVLTVRRATQIVLQPIEALD